MSTIRRRHISSSLVIAAAAAFTAIATACNGDSGDLVIGAPVAVNVTAGEGLTGQVATDAGPFVAKVVDTAGNGVQGVAVTFSISGPATLITTAVTTNQNGEALTSIHFGNTVGNVVVTAVAAGVATHATIHASSYAAPASRMVLGGGQNQSALRGSPLPDPLSVNVTDQYGNGVSGVSVVWASANGILSTTNGHTGTDGSSTTTYTLPGTPGPQTVTATTTLDGTPIIVTFNVTAN